MGNLNKGIQNILNVFIVKLPKQNFLYVFIQRKISSGESHFASFQI